MTVECFGQEFESLFVGYGSVVQLWVWEMLGVIGGVDDGAEVELADIEVLLAEEGVWHCVFLCGFLKRREKR